MKNKQIDILDVLLILAKHKKFIIWTTLIVSIIAVIYSLVVPQLWTSTAVILPLQNDSSKLSISSSSLMSLGSSFLGDIFEAKGTELLAILNSRTFSRDIVIKFNLIDYLKLDDRDSLMVMDKAIEHLRLNMLGLSLDDESGMISITIKSKDKYLSADIANYYCYKINDYNLNTRMSSGKRKRIFIETRLNEIKSDIDSLADKMKEFQEENNVIIFSDQVSDIITNYVGLVSQKRKLDIEYEYTVNNLKEMTPLIEELTQRREILKQQIENLEYSKTKNSKYIINIDDVPQLTLLYKNYEAEYRILKELYSFLYPQFETAKIEELKDLPTINVIDRAVPAGIRSWPKRAKLCIMSFLVAFILSSIIALIRNSYDNLKIDENNNSKLIQLKKYLLNK
ncbi:MAG: hypothetical protein K9N07_07125 [Candidatus Cloacimonetes bacterium]|nr:hypothetical protein [Candidatus Cloacimonadota bacterium]